LFQKILDKYIFSWVETSKLKNIFSEKNKPDIILTDKNNLAVALKYDRKSMIAPVIMEKGKNTYAQKLVSSGSSNNIPIVEDKELVNNLFSSLKTGQAIIPSYWVKIARLYSKHINFDIVKEKNKDSFEEIFETQRQQNQELFSLSLPQKIKIEVSSNIFGIVNKKYLNINIYGFLLNNVKAEENKKLENDEYHIYINGLLARNGKIIYTFIEPYEQLNIYLTECLRFHYKQLIGRDEIVYFLDQIRENYPILVSEILKYYTVGDVRKILHGLMEENVSIQNIIMILETMADSGDGEHNFDLILENVRKAIGRDICYPYLCDNVLNVFTFEYEFIEKINANFINSENGKYLNEKYVKIVHESISKAVEIFKNKNLRPVLVYGQLNRKLFKGVVDKLDREIAVISASEIPGDMKVEAVEILKLPESTTPS